MESIDPFAAGLTPTLLLSALLSMGLLAAPALAAVADGDDGEEPPPEQAAFRLPQLEAELASTEGPWLPFFDSRTLRVGLYALAAGEPDEQPIHEEDEIYHVLTGRAVLRAGSELIPVGPGSVVFVRAGVEHRFIDIEEDLKVLVIFGAPLEEGAAEQAPETGPPVDGR